MAQKTGVLLLHGLTGVPSEMRPVEKYLQKMGFDTEVPMLAGHGGTHDEMLAVHWQQWIDSAQEALDRLSQRVDTVVVGGLSMGSSIAGILASRNSNISGLIMLSPTLQYDSPELDKKLHLRMYKSSLVRGFLHHLVDLFPTVGKKIYWTETPPYGLKDERLQRQITKAIEAAQRGEDTKFGLFRTYFISLKQMNHITDDFKRAAPGIKCPTLIISSLEDTLVSMGNAVISYSLLGTQSRSVAMIDGCDHVLTLDLKRNYVCRLVGEFMEAVTGTQPASGSDDPSEITIEIHNRLNPLSGPDWARLVPGSPSLAVYAESLQRKNVHESHCHTLVVRRLNDPILMVPMVINPQDRTINFGFEHAHWGKNTASEQDAKLLTYVWTECERICKTLCTSCGLKKTNFAPPGSLKGKPAETAVFINAPERTA